MVDLTDQISNLAKKKSRKKWTQNSFLISIETQNSDLKFVFQFLPFDPWIDDDCKDFEMSSWVSYW